MSRYKDIEGPQEIVAGLFLGGVTTSYPDKMAALGITHVLTVMESKLTTKDPAVTYKWIKAFDVHSQDLLSYFNDGVDFITMALGSGGKVLVHCAFGISRSATLVIAYIMKTTQLDFHDALALVQKKRIFASPNPGFQEQLQLYKKMDCEVTPKSSVYHSYVLKRLARDPGILNSIPFSKEEFWEECDNQLLAASESDGSDSGDAASAGVFSCRVCRHPLFKPSSVVTHLKRQNTLAFEPPRPGQDPAVHPERCSDTNVIFVLPLRWLRQELEATEGKINCPGPCGSKLGNFTWVGRECSCGAWITPAFQIQGKKVENVKRYGNPNSDPAGLKASI